MKLREVIMHLIKLDDLDEINRIILNEHIQKDICDDPTANQKIDELGPYEWIGVVEDGLQGFFMLARHNSLSVEIHTCLLPTLRGTKAFEAGRMILRHIFEKNLKVISWIPENNRKAKLFAQMLGFHVEGINRASFLKDGKLLDQFLVGLTKGEFLCQWQQ
ncbi:GNAT family N-acetyltransferase [Acinetobacter baumannii]